MKLGFTLFATLLLAQSLHAADGLESATTQLRVGVDREAQTENTSSPTHGER